MPLKRSALRRWSCPHPVDVADLGGIRTSVAGYVILQTPFAGIDARECSIYILMGPVLSACTLLRALRLIRGWPTRAFFQIVLSLFGADRRKVHRQPLPDSSAFAIGLMPGRGSRGSHTCRNIESANQVTRDLARVKGSAFGWHRLTLAQLAAIWLCRSSRSADSSRSASSAVRRRWHGVVHRLKSEGGLGRFAVVADTPGLSARNRRRRCRAASRTAVAGRCGSCRSRCCSAACGVRGRARGHGHD